MYTKTLKCLQYFGFLSAVFIINNCALSMIEPLFLTIKALKASIFTVF